MENKIDWLTLTIKPETSVDSESSFYECCELLRSKLILNELWGAFENRGRCRFYDVRLSYEDVNIKIPLPEKFSKQGICIEFSSAGLDFFVSYLNCYGYTLQEWCCAFRSLAVCGWITKCTRFDFAMDDIVYDGARPTLTMRKVLAAICDNELSMRARTISDDCNDITTFKRNYKAFKGGGLWGTTVNIGNRKSDTFVRFYDKLIEQKQKNRLLPENMTSWVRCEYEFHKENAMAMFNAFCDMDTDKFGKYGCGVALNHIKFINRTSSNVSRCPIKRWWKDFLNGCSKSFHLPKIAPQRSALAKALKWLDRQLVSTLVTLMQIMTVDGFNDYIISLSEEIEKNGKPAIKNELVNNYKDCKRYYEDVSGFNHWNYATDVDGEKFRSRLSGHYALNNRHLRHIEENSQYFGWGGQMRLCNDN